MTQSLNVRALRRAAGRVRATFVGREIAAELHRLSRSGRPIVVGPWLGEVGFEILYWIPFLRWVVEAFGIDPHRIIAISRGGPSSWYRDVAGRYVDVFDHITIDAFRRGNEQRQLEIGEQKQLRVATFDDELLGAIQRADALTDADLLHPSLMYRLFQPFWWKHASLQWMTTHQRHARMAAPGLPAGLALQPGTYVAVKVYFNDCVEDTDAVRRFASDAMEALADIAPVVSLSTALDLDDHAGAREEVSGRVTSIANFVGPRNNLAVQTAVLANARAFLGTYGGFSYVAPLHGVPTLSVYSKRGAFDPAHLTVARDAFARIGAPAFDVRDVAELRATSLPEAVPGLMASG